MNDLILLLFIGILAVLVVSVNYLIICRMERRLREEISKTNISQTIQVGHSSRGKRSSISGNIEINFGKSEIELLKQMLKDKEEIIELMKSKNNGNSG